MPPVLRPRSSARNAASAKKAATSVKKPAAVTKKGGAGARKAATPKKAAPKAAAKKAATADRKAATPKKASAQAKKAAKPAKKESGLTDAMRHEARELTDKKFTFNMMGTSVVMGGPGYAHELHKMERKLLAASKKKGGKAGGAGAKKAASPLKQAPKATGRMKQKKARSDEPSAAPRKVLATKVARKSMPAQSPEFEWCNYY